MKNKFMLIILGFNLLLSTNSYCPTASELFAGGLVTVNAILFGFGGPMSAYSCSSSASSLMNNSTLINDPTIRQDLNRVCSFSFFASLVNPAILFGTIIYLRFIRNN